MFRFFGVSHHDRTAAPARTMSPVLLLLSVAFSRAVSEAPPPPPLHVRVEQGQLTWAAASERTSYTVEYRSAADESSGWKPLPECVSMSSLSCNVTGVTRAVRGAPPEDSCVLLRVRAERRALRSEPVEACSSNGSICTPAFSLLRLPGSLTVHLSDDHTLADHHADNAMHRIYFGREGQKLKKFKDTIASTTIEKLEVGQRYCVQVKYIVFGKPIEPPSCIRCAVIPASQHVNRTLVISGLVGTVFTLAFLITAVGYLLLFQRQRIKRWLRSPYRIPPDFMDFPSPTTPQVNEPPEERCDLIQVSLS